MIKLCQYHTTCVLGTKCEFAAKPKKIKNLGREYNYYDKKPDCYKPKRNSVDYQSIK